MTCNRSLQQFKIFSLGRDTNMYYKPSGRYSLGGLLTGAAVGLAASTILAYAYGRGLILISDAHFAAFATIAFGAAVGAVTGYGMVRGNVRNEKASIIATAVVATITLYISWAVWVAATLRNDPEASNASWLELALRPHALWNMICVINQYGTWTLGDGKSDATHGAELWAIWIAEAVTVIGVAPSVAAHILQLRPFCETCGCWAERGTRLAKAAPPNLTQLKRHLETKDLQPLAGLEPAKKDNSLSIALNSCPRCRLFHTLSLTHTTVIRGRFGRHTLRNSIILRHLIVRPEQAETLRLLSGNSTAGIGIPKINSAAAGKK